MLASQLIERINELIKIHGDIEIAVDAGKGYLEDLIKHDIYVPAPQGFSVKKSVMTIKPGSKEGERHDSVPKTLREISLRVVVGEDYRSLIKKFNEYLMVYGIRDSVYEEEPAKLGNQSDSVHMAGMAEYLSNQIGKPMPKWCNSPEYFLAEAVFYDASFSRYYLINNTPFAFKRRLLFCGSVMSRTDKNEGIDQSMQGGSDMLDSSLVTPLGADDF